MKQLWEQSQQQGVADQLHFYEYQQVEDGRVILTSHAKVMMVDGRTAYIGKQRYCHHCAALGLTFLAEPDSFVVIEKVEKTAVSDLDNLQAYLDSVTLDELVKELRKKGITQKAFCESIGMASRHLSAVKSSEL